MQMILKELAITNEICSYPGRRNQETSDSDMPACNWNTTTTTTVNYCSYLQNARLYKMPKAQTVRFA